MKPKSIFSVIAFSLLGFLILSFQNCSQVKNGMASSEASSISADSSSLDDSIQLISPQINTQSTNSEDDSNKVGTQVLSHANNLDTADIPMEKAVVLTLSSQQAPVLSDEPVISEQDKQTALAWCESNSKSLGLKDEAIVNAVNGTNVIKGEDQNVRRVKQILRINGNQIICSLDIESIGRSSGRLILVDSQVDHWDAHSGDLVLIHSRVKNLVRAEGKVKNSAR